MQEGVANTNTSLPCLTLSSKPQNRREEKDSVSSSLVKDAFQLITTLYNGIQKPICNLVKNAELKSCIARLKPLSEEIYQGKVSHHTVEEKVNFLMETLQKLPTLDLSQREKVISFCTFLEKIVDPSAESKQLLLNISKIKFFALQSPVFHGH